MNLTSDNVANRDLLGRDKFAKQIVHSLSKSFEHLEESIVIGITGPWGSGKSTLLSFIERHLQELHFDEQESYKIIHFNPWANSISDIEELQRALLEAIIKELESIKWKDKIEDKNNKFKLYLKYLNYLKFVKHIHPIAKNIIEAVDEYTNEASIHSVNEIKKQADKLLKETGKRIYILIDDLDRLTQDEIKVIFKAIKLNVNFLNTVFIVAYDKQVVSKAFDDNKINGEEYLEKIIQVDFAVPEILEEQMEEIFFDKLNILLDSLNISYDQPAIFKIWNYYGFKEYFRTLRDVKRYINSLTFSLPNISQEINIIDFIVLESIKVFDYSAYKKVYDDFLILQRKAVWGSSSFDNDTISQYSNPTTVALLEYLFIKNNSTAQLMNGSLNAKRLFDKEYFKRYYTLYIPSKDIAEDVLTEFLTISRNREQILEETYNNNKIKSFLRRLADKDLPKHYNILDEHILDGFLKFWDNHDKAITGEIDEYLWHAYFNLTHSFDNKFQAAKTSIQNLILRENEYQPMRFVFNYFITLFKEQNRSDPEFYEDVSNQIDIIFPDLKKALEQHIKKMYSTYLWKAAKGESLFVNSLFLIAMAKYCKDEYWEVLDQYLNNTGFLIFLLKENFLRFSSSSKKHDFYSLEYKDILLPNEKWEAFCNHLRGAKKGSWNDYDQSCVDRFLKNLDEQKL
jgi:predicted KAP-like P-loop ATPase